MLIITPLSAHTQLNVNVKPVAATFNLYQSEKTSVKPPWCNHTYKMPQVIFVRMSDRSRQNFLQKTVDFSDERSLS